MQVISQMLKKSEQMSGLDRLPAVAKGEGGDEVKSFVTESNDTDMDLSWQTGVRYTFRSRLFLLPLAGRKKGGKDVNSLTLTSESWQRRSRALRLRPRNLPLAPSWRRSLAVPCATRSATSSRRRWRRI